MEDGRLSLLEESVTRRITISEEYRLFRLIPPSGNEATISAVQGCLQNLLGREPLSLEICIGGGGTKEYFVRLPASLRPEGLLPYLRGAYPQLAWQEVAAGLNPGEDPAWPKDEQIAQVEMVQQYDPSLPLLVQKEKREDQTFDPLQSLLHLGDALGLGERILCQVVARAGSERRMRRYQRMIQVANDPQQREAQAMSARVVSSLLWPVVGGALLFGVLFALVRQNYLATALFVGFGLTLSFGLGKLRQLLSEGSDLPVDMVAEKIRYPCYDCQVRLTAFTLDQDPEAVLASAAAAYGQFGLGSANRLVARAACFDPRIPTFQ